MRAHGELRPHSTDPKILQASAQVYARNKTPEIDRYGVVTELDVRPGGPDLAASHVHEIHRHYGEGGVLNSLRGLQVTRGNQFVLQMMARDPAIRTYLAPIAQPVMPAVVRTALGSAQTGRPLPEKERGLLVRATGQDPAAAQIFDDSHAHAAAAAMGARAFTVGNRIFFGRGEYNPSSDAGRELILHEATHTLQQDGAAVPAAATIQVGAVGDRHEQQAERVARSALRHGLELQAGRGANDDGEMPDAPVAGMETLAPGRVPVQRIQRVISFTTANYAPVTNPIAADETAAGFRLQSADPTFQWQPDVTIHGSAGDPFADWETAHHQVAKGFWNNIYWGEGANRTHRRSFIDGGLPMRDATAAGNTWYSDWRAQGFAADGNVGSPVMHDRPATGREPWDNPTPGRAGNRGWFNWGFGFVSTLSVRHIPDGTGAAAFRHLNHMHWNFMVDGTFDGGLALGGRVVLNGGAVNHSAMFAGFDPANRPMHGGPIVNDRFRSVDT